MIAKEKVRDIWGLSPMQKGLLYEYLFDSEGYHYYEYLCLRVSGAVDFNFFKKSWEFVIATNEIFNVCFIWEHVQSPVQVLLKEVPIPVEYYDFSANPVNNEELLTDLKNKDRVRRFDLQTGSLFRVKLCKLLEDKFEIILSYHHILFDGWSLGIVLKEFFNAYKKLTRDEEIESVSKNSFNEFLKWIRVTEIENKEDMEVFWREYLADFETKTVLPVDQPKIKAMTDSSTYREMLAPYILDKIQSYLKANQITLGILIYLSWGILLQKYSNTRDVIFGTTVSGRPAELSGIEDMVGLFINTLPIRIKTTPNQKLSEVAKELQQQLAERQRFEWTSLVDIRNNVALESQVALFDSIVVIENYPLDQILKGSSCMKIDSFEMREITNFDLLLEVQTQDILELALSYNHDIFTLTTIQSIMRHMVNIIEKIVTDYEITFSKLELLTEQEKKQLLDDFNQTAEEWSNNTTIYELFEEQVQKNPDNIALVYEGSQLSYTELNQRANQLARILRRKGVLPDSFVGIMVERSFEMIIGILGILKAGGAYIPIDPAYPISRIEYMLENSGMTLLLLQKPIEHFSIHCDCLYFDDLEFTKESDQNLVKVNHSCDLAYMIYTSGSTGKPKGVQIEHKSIVNTLNWRRRYYGFDTTNVTLQMLSFSFDGSVTDIFTTLLGGGTVVLIKQDKHLDLLYLKNKIIQHEVTDFFVVPTLYKVFMEEFTGLESLRFITVGGEAFGESLIKEHYSRFNSVELYNEYGPTENSVSSTVHHFSTEDTQVLIGKPIANCKCYVFDQDICLQPVGASGELFLSGPGLARGYYNDERLNAEKFIQNPYTGERMYRTGDVVKWTSGGKLKFLGRSDHQVKIRGLRIEVAEIESQLVKHQSIKDAVVSVFEDNNSSSHLCAYIVTEIPLDKSEIVEYLSIRLPQFMVPTYYQTIEQIPMTPNGKVDRKRLPAIKMNSINKSQYLAPKTEVEKKLAQIWCKVLGVDKVDIEDKFFEVGGDSIKVISLLSLINKEFTTNLEVKDIFKYPTIRSLSEILGETGKKDDMMLFTL